MTRHGNGLIEILFFWMKLGDKYHELKEDEERRQTTVRMGVTSIFHSVFSAVVLVLCAMGILGCIQFLGSGGAEFFLTIFTVLGIVVLAALALYTVLYGYIGGMLCFIFQLRLNKRPIGWVALALWFAFLIGGIAAALLIITQ